MHPVSALKNPLFERMAGFYVYQLGVNPPSDIASGRAHIVRWTMVLRRPKRSVDLQRCAVEVCHAIA